MDKKEVTVCLWAGDGATKLKSAGYEHNQQLGELSTDEILQVAAKVFNEGLNVMLYHYDADVVIWVDTKRFTQR